MSTRVLASVGTGHGGSSSIRRTSSLVACGPNALDCPQPAKAEDHPMDAKTETLTPAAQLARENPLRAPGESAEYRAARNALLAEEIELRRHIERVAAQRRALPPGGEVKGDYRFMTETG